MSSTAKATVSKAARVLAEGGVVVIPTDTVYGLVARLDRPQAIDRIFKIKKRARSKPLPILVADIKTARTFADFSSHALEMAMSRWPGAVTLVLDVLDDLPDIGGDGTTVGLRIPDHPFALELLQQTGPLVGTSANPAGKATGRTLAVVLAELGSGPDLYVDGGVLDSAPSQVISLVGEARTLRP